MRNLSAEAAAKATEMRTNQRERRRMVIIVPRIGPAKSRVLIIVIAGAMESVRAPLRHYLDLAASASVKVRRLVGRRYLKLLNASNRQGNDSRGRLAVAGTVIGA